VRIGVDYMEAVESDDSGLSVFVMWCQIWRVSSEVLVV